MLEVIDYGVMEKIHFGGDGLRGFKPSPR